MPGSVLDVFKLLGDLSGDSIFAERARISADQILVAKKDGKDAKLAKAYLEAEHELVKRMKGTLRQEDLRGRAAALVADAEPEFQGFRLLFLPPEPQLVALASTLVVAYAERGRLFFGRRASTAMVSRCLADTPWKDVQIDLIRGFTYNAVRMRTVAECSEIVSALFERWHEMFGVLYGGDVSRRIFELAYRDVESAYGFLPMAKNLLGLTPRAVLWADKVKRLHELEMQTDVQARDIRAADVDLRRQAEQLQVTVKELEETRARLEIVGKARSEFIDVVSHQFRTPLSSIRWNGELLSDALAEKKIPEEYADAVDTVRSRSVYLIETLDRVFATLEIETGTLVVDAKPAFLWEIVQDAYAHLEKDIKRNGLKWKFERMKDQPREIPIDKVKMSTVMKIVLGNAVMYNKKGGKLLARVSEETIDGVDYQVCTVTDEGIGIPKEDQDRVFEKFYRSKPSVLHVADGTGLGMFIVKNFVEAHRGMVQVKSAGEGKGTSVAIALPVK
ncbi:MAG TPA: HAMP domain-containing sensor histidine kinase [Patescibacteria group bacterium]|nr:HAMP domain-containing sensor histidine kinase [Patescibacteria group bacterium]